MGHFDHEGCRFIQFVGSIPALGIGGQWETEYPWGCSNFVKLKFLFFN